MQIKPSSREYVVVEQAGYEGEADIRRFDTYAAALRFLDRHYDGREEIEALHVEIACEIDGERTYEI